MDVVVPIVFPDYKIFVEFQSQDIDIFPGFDFDDFKFPGHKKKYSNLGHAGVLFINGNTGETKYFEYGRYDVSGLGRVQRVPLPDVQLSNGEVVISTLKPVLAKISRVSGQRGRIKGVYIEVESKFHEMLKYVNERKSQNLNANRDPYDILTNSCIHFVKQTALKAGVDTPWMIDPRPNSYIGEFRDDFLDLDYSSGTLTIESKGDF